MNYIKNGNWVRYQNGNYFVSINLDNGTKIRETINPNATEFVADFPESADVKITNRCPYNCAFCHEGSNINGKHSDALHSHVWNTFCPYTEVALGGGSVTGYPDLVPLLERLKSLHLIPNITVRQEEFMSNLPLIRKLTDEKLIYGLGISLSNPNQEDFIKTVKEFPNAVIHVINGIVSLTELRKLANNNLKILILGYKEVRKGKILLANSAQNTIINNNKEALYAFLPKIIT